MWKVLFTWDGDPLDPDLSILLWSLWRLEGETWVSIMSGDSCESLRDALEVVSSLTTVG